MARSLYLNCFSGISGDMFLGAMLDLGLPPSVLEDAVTALNLQDRPLLQIQRLSRGTIAGTKFNVQVKTPPQPLPPPIEHHSDHPHPHETPSQEADHGHGHEHQHHHGDSCSHTHDSAHAHGRSFADIRHLIGHSTLSEPVKERTLAMFHLVAVAEAKIHGKSIDDVHFHEVGAIDSIVDLVGAAAALEHFQFTEIHASSLVEGTGWIQCAHGKFPLPAPATAEILAGIPLSQSSLPYEMITPTGAAILKANVASFGPLHNFVTTQIGYGLGTRDLPEQPNVLRALIGTVPTAEEAKTINPQEDEVTVFETNLDDLTPEELALATDHLWKAGALDVVTSPLSMKKGRPGWQLQVIVTPGRESEWASLIMRHTSAFGVRWRKEPRFKLARQIETFHTPFGPLPAKLGFWNGELVQVRPEYEPCRKAADRLGLPLHHIFQAVLAASNQKMISFHKKDQSTPCESRERP